MESLTKKNSRPKRKQVYINKNFQTRFIVKFVLVLVIGGAISIGLTFFATQDTLTTTFANSRLVIQKTAVAIMPSVIYTTLVTTAVVGLIMVIVALLVSHKIAGPVYRFEKDIERIAKGDLKNHVNIRKDDQFQEVAASLNTMIDHLNASLSEIQDQTVSLAGNIDLPEACRRDIVRLNKTINSRFTL